MRKKRKKEKEREGEELFGSLERNAFSGPKGQVVDFSSEKMGGKQTFN